MPVFRLYAYAVPANKNADPPTLVRGGALSDLSTLGEVVAATTSAVRTGQWTKLVLNVDPTSSNRESPVRTAILDLAFGGKDRADADAAAEGLAERLSQMMDQRTDRCLLVIAASRDNDSREVTFWTFPRDDALQFSTGDEGPSVAVVQDAFSRQSHLRKAFTANGADQGPTSFLTGQAVDLVTGGTGQLADYWIKDFLDAVLSVSEGEGSRTLARALRAAWDGTTDQSQREQFLDAAIGVRKSTRSRWSVKSFADEYLTGAAKALFLRTSEARKLRSEQFHFSLAAFDKIIKLRVLSLDNGIRVSVPFAEADDLLSFEETEAGTRVTASGLIREDKVSQRG